MRRTLAQVQGVFVVSEWYRRQLASETDRPLIVLGNGVEMAHFGPPRTLPPELLALACWVEGLFPHGRVV